MSFYLLIAAATTAANPFAAATSMLLIIILVVVVVVLFLVRSFSLSLSLCSLYPTVIFVAKFAFGGEFGEFVFRDDVRFVDVE
jgi:hypothetical protein